MVKSINKVTNNPVYSFAGKVVSISDEVRNLTNSKQTPFVLATGRFVNNKGEIKTTSCILYTALLFDKEGTQRLTVGDDCLINCEVTPERPNEPFVTMTLSTTRVSLDDLGLSLEDIQPASVETTVKNKVTIK